MSNLATRFYQRLFTDSIPPPQPPPKAPVGFWGHTWLILKDAFAGFMDDRCLKYSASLAYYTLFSLAPLLVLIIALAGIFLGEEAIRGQLFHELNGLMGNQAAKQVQDMVKQVNLSGKTNVALLISIATLVVGATSLFVEIQDSINLIWGLKVKPKQGWLKLFKDRLLSSSLIVSLGFLLLVALLVNGVLLAASDQLSRWLPGLGVYIISALNFLVSTLVAALLFGVIFKVLPDARIRWRDVRWSALFTALLFVVGRYLIGLYIDTTATGSAYGAAGSLIVILTWIYYMAVILYFGAEFTQAYANQFDLRIEPTENAVYVEQTERERPDNTIPPKSNTTQK